MALLSLIGPAVLPAQAAFSSLYVFGDGVCTTTASIDPQSAWLYYGSRFCNGRVWVEVLAQRQAITFSSAKNLSAFGQTSTNLLTSISQFAAPADASNSLFVVWVSDADFVGDMNIASTDMGVWNSYLSKSLANHAQAISNLYAKGARTLLMPNAVDITQIPQYSGSEPIDRGFVYNRIVQFNTNFTTIVKQVRGTLPGLTIYTPDFFSLLQDMLAHAGSYGLVNAQSGGHTVGALGDPNMYDYTLWGPGSSYIFWDPYDPSARAHAVMADVTQQLISPAKLANVTTLGRSNRLDVVSLPLGHSGFVEARASLVPGSWMSLTNFNSTSSTQSIFVPASASPGFYRLRFPFAWSYP
jgi:phospholipase/lecithinase/hemolysin